MMTLESAPSNRRNATGVLMVSSMALALADALQRSLTSQHGAPVALSPAVLRPLKLLPRRMLLVGEDEPRQKSALEVLAKWEIPAELASGGTDAVQLASTGDFDLVLIDAKKSVLDGVFVSSRLRHLERKRHQQATVALVAGVSGDWPAGESVLRMAGVDDVLKVGSEGAAVGECLRRWCSGRYRSKAH